MDHAKDSVEFEATIDQRGVVRVPTEMLERLTVRGGAKVMVRITAEKISDALKKRTVTEEEIDRISKLQMEPRENVVKFLTTEGALSKNRGFMNRAKKAVG